MRLSFAVSLFTAAFAFSQAPAPAPPPVTGTAYGQLAEPAGEGGLRIRAPERHVYTVRVEPETRVVWRAKELTIADLVPGDLLQLDLEKSKGEAEPVAREIRLIDPAPVQSDLKAASQFRNVPPPNYRSPTEKFAPRGQLTYSGVVTDLEASQITLQPRKGDKVLLRLRADTRYVEDGLVKQHESLRLQTIVFVRAGRAFDGSLEAFQVMWGGILGAR